MRFSILGVACALIFAGTAQAGLIGFEGVTNNDAGNTMIGESQLLMDVTDAGLGLVQFTLLNTGPEACVIGQIYFDGDLLDAIDSIQNNLDVMFSPGGSPANLRGGEAISFLADFMASADPPPSMNGVGPGESVGITVSYVGVFDDVLAALASGDLRVGLHVIGYADGGSESFVNIVPAPGVLSALMLAGLAGTRRRRA